MIKRREFIGAVGSTALALPLTSVLGQQAVCAANDRPKIKIGQIGTKHAHAGGKIATMRKFSELFEVVGVVEPDAKRRAEMQKHPAYRGLKWMNEKELLTTEGLQAVAVETEVRQLVPTAARCVAAGMHIHLDKPAGASLAPFKNVLDDATRQSKVVQMGYMFRYNPAFQFLFKALKDGWLGNVFEVHAVISKTVGDASRRKLSRFAGGSMFELGCHVIDAVVTVLGKPQKVTSFSRRTQPEKDDLADNCLAVFEYKKATATVRSALVEVDGGRRRQFVVCGNHGTIDIKPLEPPHLQLTLDRDRGKFKRGTQEVELPRLGGRYDGDFLDLAKIIHGEKKTDFPPSHDLAVQESVLRASGMPVD